jgi:hypothetical protein
MTELESIANRARENWKHKTQIMLDAARLVEGSESLREVLRSIDGNFVRKIHSQYRSELTTTRIDKVFRAAAERLKKFDGREGLIDL